MRTYGHGIFRLGEGQGEEMTSVHYRDYFLNYTYIRLSEL